MHLYTPFLGDVPGDLVPIHPHVVTELPGSAYIFLSGPHRPVTHQSTFEGRRSRELHRHVQGVNDLQTHDHAGNHLLNGTHVLVPFIIFLGDFVILVHLPLLCLGLQLKGRAANQTALLRPTFPCRQGQPCLSMLSFAVSFSLLGFRGKVRLRHLLVLTFTGNVRAVSRGPERFIWLGVVCLHVSLPDLCVILRRACLFHGPFSTTLSPP